MLKRNPNFTHSNNTQFEIWSERQGAYLAILELQFLIVKER